MIVSLSAVVLLGLLLAVLVHSRRLGLVTFGLCTAFGFLLATSPLAPLIRAVITWAGTMISTVHI